MAYEQLPTLSSKKDDLIYVMCIDCELLRKMDYANLMEAYGDVDLLSLRGPIAKDIINCGKEPSGYNKCRLNFYDGPETLAIKNIKAPEVYNPKLEYMASWEVVVAKCRFCGHVANIPSWRVKRMAKPGVTLDDLKKRLRCGRCKHKGDVGFTIAKLPR